MLSPTKSTFLEKNFGGTRHPCEKNEPTLDQSRGGVHGEACWLIAYGCTTMNNVLFKCCGLQNLRVCIGKQ